MQELYRYEVTDRDLLEMFGVLARCRGSKTHRQLFRSFLLRGVILIVIYAAILAQYRQIIAAHPVLVPIFSLLLIAALPFGWLATLNGFAHAQVQQLRMQKKAAGLAAAAPELHSIRLEGKNYVRRVGERASTSVPLAALHTTKPMKGGGVVLLFHTGAEDYLPPTLFSPAYTARDFCFWINEQAAGARRTPVTLGQTEAGGAGQDAAAADSSAGKAEACIYLLRFTLDTEAAARLLSLGCRRLYRTAGYWKQQLRGFGVLTAAFFVFAVIGGLGLPDALLAAMILSGGLLLFGLAVTLLLASRIAYRMRLGAGAMDSLLGPQQVEFFPDRITVCRAAGRDDQSYSFYAQLLDTPDAWFLVSQGAGGLLPLPKEVLPQSQHAAFAAFVEEKLRTAAQRPDRGK